MIRRLPDASRDAIGRPTRLETAEGDGRDDDKKSKLNAIIATSVAIAATFMALCNVKAGNVVQAMGKVQVDIVDTWSYFQAKSTKQSLAEASAEQLHMQDGAQLSPAQAAALEKNVARLKEKVARYEKEKDELKAKADELQNEYDRLNVKDDQFDISEALLSVGIALFGITALTQKRWLLFVAFAFGTFGFVVGLAGFVGWNVRPELIAKILGA